MSILDLLQYIVNEPAPRLTPPGKYPREAELFIDDCLRKDPGLRKNPKELLVSFYLDSGLGYALILLLAGTS